MRISLFSQITDNHPLARVLSWQEFVREFDPHVFTYETKGEAMAFSPAEYPEGARRAKDRVVRVHFGVLDIDKKTDQEIQRLMAALEGYEHIVYTTWSHAEAMADGLWRIRVLLPFSRPVEGGEWKNFWPRLNRLFAGLNDPACKDASRVYFIPAAPKGTEADQVFEYQEGKEIDVDALMAVPIKIEDVASESIDVRQVAELIPKLKRRQSAYYQRIAGNLKDILDGKVFAEEGKRDETIFQVTGVLAEHWPSVDARALAQVFATSLGVMSATSAGCPTLEEVRSKIQRHQQEVHAKQQELDQKFTDALTVSIRQAFGGERQHPYTDIELARYAHESGVAIADFKKLWVIQKARSYYIFFNGAYNKVPVSDVEFTVAAAQFLAPAHTAGVNLYKMDQKGNLKIKTTEEIMLEYGSIANEIEVDLTAQKTQFKIKTSTFIEAPCPLRKLTPEYDDQVDTWLRWFAGDQFEVISDWLAVATRLDEPCAALYLDGAPNAGKTMFAEGVARLWTTERASKLENAMSNFNDGLSKCPLVLADETIPRDYRGRARTAELREFIQARTRPLNRKFLPSATIRGAVRVVITANNQELFVSNEALTENDIQAIVDRIIYIYCPKNAAKYLKSVDAKSFVTQDRLAKHALWLAKNRIVRDSGRFLVQGRDSSLHRTLTTSSGLRSAVCNWLVAFLLSPVNGETGTDLLVRRYQGELLVTARALAQGWNIYPTNEPAPTAGRVSLAIAGLSTGQKVQLRDKKNRRTHYWVIDKMNLVQWAERNGYATQEVLEHALTEESDPQKVGVNMN